MPDRSTRRSRRRSTTVQPFSLREFITGVEEDERHGTEFVHHQVMEGQAAITSALDPPLPPALGTALRARGIQRLFSHQVEAIQRVRAGSNVVTVTPTASGKTLTYLLPIFERILHEPDTRAILLFPIKALANDQMKKIRELILEMGLVGEITVETYDGDTPRGLRTKLRKDPPNLLLTNPDMINHGLLPYHTLWQGLFENLRYIVVDELHGYKGVFGSHVLHVLRRLRRVCAFHRAVPQFIATSATIANPGELAETLTGLPFEVIERSGAPRAERHVLFVNPTGSLYTSAVRLLEASVNSGFKTIVFTKARRITELIHTWTVQSNPTLAGRLSAYRSGYLPQERREIEHKLSSGELDAVIATSALEMGIDIGGLDVAILVGYPGSIASTWQRGGRVGRKDRDSAIFLLALPDALDQYFMRHPADFFARPVESAVVDPTNPYLLKPHLTAAAAEAPLRADDIVYPRTEVGDTVDELVAEEQLLEAVKGQVWFAKEKTPQRGIDIRGGGETFAIHEQGTSKLIGRVNGWQALTECHPGAIYLHGGRTFEISRLDLGAKDVAAKRADVSFYTQARTEKDTEILEVFRSHETNRYKVSLGKLKVTERVVGYEKRSTSGREKLSDHPLELPPVSYESVGLWFEPPTEAVAGLLAEKRHPMGSLHAVEHASLALTPLFALCDRNDLGGISFTRHPDTGGAAVFLYDGHPGGLGLADRAYEVLDDLFRKTLELVRDCPCEEGCPSCVHSPKCGNGNQPLDKAGAVRLLEHLTGGPELKDDPALTQQAFGDAPLAQTAPVIRNNGRPSTEAPQDELELDDMANQPWSNQLPHLEGRDILVFDLETQLSASEVGGWANIHLMRMSVGVLWEMKTGEYLVYREHKAEALIKRMAEAEMIVGFNNKRFDNTVLTAYTGEDLRAYKNLDLLEELHHRHGFRVKLDDLVQATLGIGKSADGLQALAWFKEGRMDEIIEYCKKDVEVTAKLFLFIAEHGYVHLERHGEIAKLPFEMDLAGFLGEPDLFGGMF